MHSDSIWINFIDQTSNNKMTLPTITLTRFTHRGKQRLGLEFDYNSKLIQHTKLIKDIRWSQSRKCWHVRDDKHSLYAVFNHYKGMALINNALEASEKRKTSPDRPPVVNAYKKLLGAEQKAELEDFRQHMQSLQYSSSTIDTYLGMLSCFFGYQHPKRSHEIRLTDVDKFNFDVIVKHRYSIVYQRQVVSALKLFYRNCDQSAIIPDMLQRPRASKRLPVVLSREEVLRLLVATPNLKHRCILSLLYGSGMRISELINLRIADVDFARNQLFIRQGKQRKDRVVSLSERIHGLLNDYLRTYNPDTYLFNGQAGIKYTSSSVRHFLARSVKKAGIKKHITPHTLRHTYATHLIESGISLKYVQELLGHTRPETTQIYLHITQKQLLTVSSPLDSLLEEAGREHDRLDKSNRNLFLT